MNIRTGNYRELIRDPNRGQRGPVCTSLRSPWQNGIAERWIGSFRRGLLDHVIAVDERHLKRLLADYVDYYHDDRTNLGLGKGTPIAGLVPTLWLHAAPRATRRVASSLR